MTGTEAIAFEVKRNMDRLPEFLDLEKQLNFTGKLHGRVGNWLSSRLHQRLDTRSNLRMSHYQMFTLLGRPTEPTLARHLSHGLSPNHRRSGPSCPCQNTYEQCAFSALQSSVSTCV